MEIEKLKSLSAEDSPIMSNLPAKISADIVTKLNETVGSVISAAKISGFHKAYLLAQATADLKLALTPEYMAPIMELQGSRLGFKTDKDKEGGYKIDVVKSCLIEAVLIGVQPFGNQFNIIAGNCYTTKEGLGHLLSSFKGLEHEIIPALPRISGGSAAVLMKITWTINGKTEVREIDFAIRVNNGMGADAVIGKATRKARHWLFSKLTGIEIGEGDVTDIDSKVVSSKLNDGISLEDIVALYEEKRPLLSEVELRDAERIILGKEENSYKKLHSILTAK